MSNTALLERQAILSKIAELEDQIAQLHATLPPAIQTFYQYRLARPAAHAKILVYAHSPAEADSKVRARLDEEYGPGNWTLQGPRRPFLSAEHACGNAGSSLMRSLSPDDAESFLRDYEATQKGRADNGKNDRKNQLQHDIEDYKARKLKEERELRPARLQSLVGSSL